jgi:hypothetical protein
MLRARKVLVYVAERIESDRLPPEAKDQPDDWLELICQEKVYFSLTSLIVGCSSELDFADDSSADVETGWGYSFYISAEI